MTEDVERDHLGEIDMDTKKPFRCPTRHGSRDGGAPVATLREVSAQVAKKSRKAS